jgi:hypothetical protein
VTDALGPLSFPVFALAAVLLARAMRSGTVEAVLAGFLALIAEVVAVGTLLSALGLLASPGAWLAGAAVILAVAAGIERVTRTRAAPGEDARLPPLREVARFVRRSPGELGIALRLLAGTATAALVLTLAVGLGAPPHGWDAMSFHLARAAYYLQHGMTAAFPANYWAQVVHPKNSALLHVYALVAANRRDEFVFLWATAAWIASALAVYGIARRAGAPREHAAIGALVYSLLTTALMQANTATNDGLIAALLATCVTFLAAHARCPARPAARRRIAAAGVAFALALGMKATVLLALPAVVGLAAYFVFAKRDDVGRRPARWVFLVFSWAVALACFTAPAGYVENWKQFGHPVFPPKVRAEFAVRGSGAAAVLRGGAKNVLRYGAEFLTLDGMPMLAPFERAQRVLRAAPRAALSRVGIDLEDGEGTRFPFAYDKPPVAHEDYSYFGVLGFALLVPATLAATLRARRRDPAWALAACALVYVLSVAFLNPFDPYRGRHFLFAGVLSAAAFALVLPELGRAARASVLVLAALGCFSAGTAILFRINGAVLPLAGEHRDERSIFTFDRIGAQTRNNPAWERPIRAFDALVPARAAVAVALPQDHFEYPLFGDRLTRTLDPVAPFLGGPRDIPARDGYLLYAIGLADRRPTDLPLGAGWFLRDLAKGRR